MKAFRNCLALILFITASGSSLQAQTIKTDVLVVGEGNAAFAAGIQSAVSNAKATVLLKGSDFKLSLDERNNATGIAADLSGRLKRDSASLGMATLARKWTDSLAQLTVVRQVQYKLSRSGSGWVAKTSDGKTYKARVLVNASGEPTSGTRNGTKKNFSPYQLKQPDYRASVAAGDWLPTANNNNSILHFSMLLTPQEENYVDLSGLESSLDAGQAAGALAAYAAFFKTKTSTASFREIQGELLNFKQALIPLADVGLADSNWRALQMISLSGVIKPVLTDKGAYFNPQQEASLQEIAVPLIPYYDKASIWFEDHPKVQADLDHTISLICFLSSRSVAQVKKDVEKKWSASYRLGAFPKEGKVLTRRELAVLLNDYLGLFQVRTDLNGRIIK